MQNFFSTYRSKISNGMYGDEWSKTSLVSSLKSEHEKETEIYLPYVYFKKKYFFKKNLIYLYNIYIYIYIWKTFISFL